MPTDPVTPRELFLNRRTWLRGGLIAAGMGATALAYKRLNGVDLVVSDQPELEGLVRVPADGLERGFTTKETQTSLGSITNYNNFYEFSTDKDGVAAAAKDFDTTGWKLEVGGLVNKPRTYDLDDLRRRFPPEERIYRMRCVEAWSMVIPWAGFPIASLLADVQPLASAKYVAFETLHDPARMPNQKRAVLPWPYVEGLRIDEAMNPLAILATGLYGAEMPPQDGAPIRLVTPWKYGFKGIKSIVKITLTDKQPPSTWNIQAPGEYGFYANVNPTHAHPRWSQATEQRIGDSGRRDTLMFNGYADQVAHLYAGQDLHVDY